MRIGREAVDQREGDGRAAAPDCGGYGFGQGGEAFEAVGTSSEDGVEGSAAFSNEFHVVELGWWVQFPARRSSLLVSFRVRLEVMMTAFGQMSLLILFSSCN